MAEHLTNSFVSCIKIKGIHLLPPLITQKRRAELQGYKQQAIKLEKRLQNCRDLKKNLEEILNMQSVTDRPQSEFSFRDDCHVEALGITENIMNNSKTKMPRQIRLTKDIVDVTQYDSDGVKIICSDASSTMFHQGQYLSSKNSKENTNTDAASSQFTQIKTLFPINKDIINNKTTVLYSEETSEQKVDTKNSNRSSSESDSVKNRSSSFEKSPKPRLIRSNSYTLDTPSPILLAHLEKTEKSNKYDELRNEEDKKLLSISRNWSSLEDNYVPFENSEFSSLKTVYNTNFNDSDNEDLQSSTPIDKNGSSGERNASPSIQVFHTDISVQKITVNSNNDFLNDASIENCETSDSQLRQVLKTLPDVYAKQIIDLIEAQKLENPGAVDKKESKENINILDRIPDRGQNTTNNNSKNEDVQNFPMNMNLNQEYQNIVQQNISLSESEQLLGSTLSLSPSQSIYYSLSCDTLRPISNTSLRLPDFDYDNTVALDEKPDPANKANATEYYRQRMNVSRELFPELDHGTYKNIKQEWAASIIGAHVKGYLTRRLLKTERVQSLIETIKDALLCALQLHSSENIDESDVELHRRLINQVSAACYTFHDIFFSLAVQEQMLIISTDRQRKLEKAKRPVSAPTSRRSKSSSARSTPRSRLSSQSQSLTKV